ncbi:MAG: carboxypeptidase M32 [Hoeflea sp.]|uniref:carboxypeptidase M32 n=1 Tax=Hoeflea sp. TaxID=1940281 RepID=UPI001D68EBD7|nr:carboxypeptidase M32 [Hoeflea sp.]MBU4529491.1 carboxypeptidase M32 [Alphaproteobacteria bacterium]MBU4546610.1 carboxypeptidase M32 [Alphaproteobacteria bacterium]MBU4550878.1 carboxypeptidase M32 [Alphaproteobacteria bacterium]MBV1723820.1 carboxypeptidase M32 [Hoeflea sp.]MBV1763097.1 carboxypeptidase M32 [Hoeflea sp.]
MSFAKLDDHCRALGALDHALSILGTDEATNMAPGGGEARAEAMASLSGMYHRQATDPKVRDWIEAAKSEDLTEEQKIAVGELERSYINMTCLPSDFVERRMRTSMRSEQLWRKARPGGDWAAFEPALEGVVAMMREEAALRADALQLAPYDALMEQYDPGNRTATITPVFDELKAFLVDFVPRALDVQEQRQALRPLKPLSGDYPVERQKTLGLVLMQAVGFDMNHGSLSVSDHPFCGGVPTDVRMTTRYRTDEFLPALMGILHETGHGLYEQNLPKDWAHWPSGKARGMSLHESQSLFVEKQIGRNPAFWRFALPLVDAHLKESWTIEDLLPHVHQVKRGKIRVDADEVTYPLHVILRYELEQDLLTGRLEVKDLPEAWDEKMQASLGISTLDDPKNGPMQDVHWPSGAFGYFPSYTLGALMAAQQWAAIARTNPDVDAQIAAGDFDAVNAWRRDNIWSKASTGSTPEILKNATGEELNPAFFIAHLEARYGQ